MYSKLFLLVVRCWLLFFYDNIANLEDWYNISISFFENSEKGISLLHYYKNMPVLAVLDIFSDHEWKVWKFSRYI